MMENEQELTYENSECAVVGEHLVTRIFSTVPLLEAFSVLSLSALRSHSLSKALF